MAEPYFSEKLGPSSKPKKFKTREELASFCQDWIGKWQWIQRCNWSSVVQLYSPFITQFNSAVGALSKLPFIRIGRSIRYRPESVTAALARMEKGGI